MQLNVTSELGKIHQGDCLELLKEMEEATIDLAFADPPFNIGYQYDQYHDRQDEHDYVDWCVQWMSEIQRVLKPNGTFWLAIGDEYAAELKLAAQREVGFSTRSWVVWYYTFGVNCTRKFSRSHAHLFHFVKDENDFTFNSHDGQVRVPSARALVYADKRANPAGRLPDDTWILRPQDLPDGFKPTDDTWYYARVAGTFKERQGFHGCQMPEQLLGRIIRVSSNPGDIVLDPFAGSGTTVAVAKKLSRRWIGFEVSNRYVREATERLDAIKPGDVLNGPSDPIGSAPTTTNGRRLEGVSFENRASASEINNACRCNTSVVTVGTTVGSENSRAHLTKSDELRRVIDDAIINAFNATHEGYSIDWLLASPGLQGIFQKACRDSGLIGNPAEWNRRLLRLRKSGRFPHEAEVKRITFSASDMENYSFPGEIAWRLTSQRFLEASLDEILCDPEKTVYFDRTAKRFSSSFDATGCRWAALRLRKASKKLVQTMKRFHFVVGTRDFRRRVVRWQSCDFDRLMHIPGVYMLYDEEKRGLFLDQTSNLGHRLLQHAACNWSTKKVGYLSVIPPDELPGPNYEKALKVDLVRRYDPCFNVNLARLFDTVAS